MTSLYRGFRFPKAIIQHAIWLYLRFHLSLREVEEPLAGRGVVVTYETVRVWVARLGRKRCPGTAFPHGCSDVMLGLGRAPAHVDVRA